MLFLFIALIGSSFCILGSDSCWRRNEPEEPETDQMPNSTSSANMESTTTCPLIQQCVQFSQMYKESMPMTLIDACVPFLFDSCISSDGLMQFINLSDTYLNNLTSIAGNILDNHCNCRNRSIELLCHFLFPNCSVKGYQCDSSVCPQQHQATLLRPCSSYCQNFTLR